MSKGRKRRAVCCMCGRTVAGDLRPGGGFYLESHMPPLGRGQIVQCVYGDNAPHSTCIGVARTDHRAVS